ncbi:MAG: hypothetical protein JWR06_2200, partial [Jatrophihabitans sp.]|nr:hypothetical protein [Jatrophihabitans sp.]
MRRSRMSTTLAVHAIVAIPTDATRGVMPPGTCRYPLTALVGECGSGPDGRRKPFSRSSCPSVEYEQQNSTTRADGPETRSAASDQSTAPTQAKVTGLANGTYFWHVYTTAEGATPNDLVSGSFSPPRSFTVTGSVAGTLPAPNLVNPPNGFQYHPLEAEHNDWTAVPGADHYLFEYDNEP